MVYPPWNTNKDTIKNDGLVQMIFISTVWIFGVHVSFPGYMKQMNQTFEGN